MDVLYRVYIEKNSTTVFFITYIITVWTAQAPTLMGVEPENKATSDNEVHTYWPYGIVELSTLWSIQQFLQIINQILHNVSAVAVRDYKWMMSQIS